MADEIRNAFSDAWRNYVTDGVPSSGKHAPKKADIRNVGVIVQGSVDAIQTVSTDAALAVSELSDDVGAIDGRVTTVESDVADLAASQVALAIGFKTWSALSAVSGTATGQLAEVVETDTGTHTDPVVGGTVANSGRFRWSASPSGWEWIGPGLGSSVAESAARVAEDRIEDVALTTPPALARSRDGAAMIGYDLPSRSLFVPGEDRRHGAGPLGIVAVFGQSGAAGGAALPAINTMKLRPYRHLMFTAAGLAGLGNTPITNFDLTRVGPAYSAGVETYLPGFVHQLCAIEDAAGYDPRARLTFNAGFGGASITTLGNTSLPSYQNVIAGVRAAHEWSHGKCEFEVLLFDQGEADWGMAQATYEGHVTALYDNLVSDLTAIDANIFGRRDGAAKKLLMLWRLPPSSVTSGAGDTLQDALISLDATARASASNRQIRIGAVSYPWPHIDLLHLSPRSNMLQGGVFAEAYHAIRSGGQSGVIRATGATIDGSDIVVATDAAYPLVEDSAKPLRTWTMAGVRVVNGSDVAQTVSAAVVDSGDPTKIRITCAATPSPGWKVLLGRGDDNSGVYGPGAGTNFRDSRPAVSSLRPDVHLYQWLLNMEIVVT